MPEPVNKALYNKVKSQAKRKFKTFPSVYASAWIVREYKKRGGKYRGKLPSKEGLKRWFAEEWIDVCKLPKKVPCGRSGISSDMKQWKKKYPYCRPSIRINSRTPKTIHEVSKKTLKKNCKKKRKSPLKKMKKV